MTLKDLISSNCWLNVLLKMNELDLDRSAESLSGVYDKLCTTAAIESDIFINIKEKKEFNTRWFEVYGTKPFDNLDCSLSYTLEFTPWEEWLGMEIDTETLFKFEDLEIICHCLLEMTFISVDEEQIKKEFNIIKCRIQELEESDYNKSNYISWEDVKERFEEFRNNRKENDDL